MDHARRLPPLASSRRRAARALLGAFALGALCGAAPLAAQEPPPPAPADTAVVPADTALAPADTAAPPPETAATPAARGTSPRGAFLRAALLPGWGHASIGSYHRGAFYFVAEGASAWMLVKTRRRFSDAQGRLRFEEGLLRADLAEQGITEEAEIVELLDADATLEDLRNLRAARRQQREDWTAVSIFLVLLAGVDAYVSAHLQHFPAPLTLDAQPVGNGRVEFSLGISLPR